MSAAAETEASDATEVDTRVDTQGTGAAADGSVIGIIGVGDMGEGIANSLLRNGWDVLAYARRPEVLDGIRQQGARVAATVPDLAAASDVVVLVVTDDEQVVNVMDGMLPHARPGTVFLCCSTILPSTVIGLAGRARDAGCEFVDCGVAGGREKADRGLLTTMIGGSDEAVARCMPVIATFSSNPFHLGPAGAGVAGKLVNNVMSAAHLAVTMEAMEFAAAYGMTEDKVTEIVTLSGGDSKIIRTWGRYDRIRREYWPDRPRSEVYSYVTKDLRSAVYAGGEKHVVLPLISAAASLLPAMYAKRDAALADVDVTALPRCSVCHAELSVTYRARGVHPECVF